MGSGCSRARWSKAGQSGVEKLDEPRNEGVSTVHSTWIRVTVDDEGSWA